MRLEEDLHECLSDGRIWEVVVAKMSYGLTEECETSGELGHGDASVWPQGPS
jgi:hypothetical protein